jgi:hypothetical protein
MPPDDARLGRAGTATPEYSLSRSWAELRERFLPVEPGSGLWRYNRGSSPGDPVQGWKLHVSATVLSACDVFGRIAGPLAGRGVQFKAPRELTDLGRLNSGIELGYSQIGKFVTVYPRSDSEAVSLADELHALTSGLESPAVPFDAVYVPGSCVHYRYGAFAAAVLPDGSEDRSVFDRDGNRVPDDRERAVPAWVENPFPVLVPDAAGNGSGSPFATDFLIVSAISQRGKGGIYDAIDVTGGRPAKCVVKEGRKNGEVSWTGTDGRHMILHEGEVLRCLARRSVPNVPRVIAEFERKANRYLVIGKLPGISAEAAIRRRRRRLSVRRVLEFGSRAARLIAGIHRAGWIWNDCKPANILVGERGELYAIDFENAFRIGFGPPFEWASPHFAAPDDRVGPERDVYGLAATLAYLLTGKLAPPRSQIDVGRDRANVPPELRDLIRAATSFEEREIDGFSERLKAVPGVSPDSRIF